MNNRKISDYTQYNFVELDPDVFEFFQTSIEFYLRVLESDFEKIKEDEDLIKILDSESLEKSGAFKEITRIRRLRDWMNKIKADAGPDAWDYTFPSISHSVIRLLKSMATLYLQQLKNRRVNLTRKGHISSAVLSTVDARLAQLEEKVTMGIFKDAELIDLQVGDINEYTEEDTISVGEKIRSFQTPIIPVIIKSDLILDVELQHRCLDLFESFKNDGAHERLDTVVSEATRILEDRLRKIAGIEKNVTGVDLAKQALGTTPPVLLVSDIQAEQDAAHLLFRGVFGFIRNSVHHHIVGELKPERVIQILGTIDYLLSVIEGATKSTNEDVKPPITKA